MKATISARPYFQPALFVAIVLLMLRLGPLSGHAATARITGEPRQWHKITLTLEGPTARESDTAPNPFTDYRFAVTFRHESGTSEYHVPGYFAADGNAANTSATAGNQWRAHLAPDRVGRWTWRVTFVRGKNAAVDTSSPVEPVADLDGLTGSFAVSASDKTGRDFRSQGRLDYVGQHYLRFAGSGEFFLKAGADTPENLLAYADFDGTSSNRPLRPARAGEATPSGLKTWKPHVQDWRPGDPTWKDGRGKSLIGALNYLSGKGCNAFSFLTYNAGGDGDDVWPFVERNDKFHYDCSKLDQWQIVFDHAQARGLYLHFKLQETENDDRNGPGAAQSLDGGDLGPERRLYLRELIARFGHELALNWNLGEENTQSADQQRAMAAYMHDTDAYHHPIVVHTYPDWQDRVYSPLVGDPSALTGASLQNSWSAAHQRTLKWVTESEKAGRPWVVANDEQNPAEMGVPPDPGYAGQKGVATQDGKSYTLRDIRKFCLWGTLMAGGAGVEYYFGYRFPQNDLNCEDWRSRDRSWDYCRIALAFFHDHRIPFWEMTNADALVGNPAHDNSRYCFAKDGEVYVVFLPTGGTAELDLGKNAAEFSVRWFNPRTGVTPPPGPVSKVSGPGKVSLGLPPAEPGQDWVVWLSR